MDDRRDTNERLTPQLPTAARRGDMLADNPAPMDETPIAAPPNAFVRFFTSHPTGFWFFFWGEFAERCSYYGMRAILALYMADVLGLGKANAATYMSFFMAACYFLPLVGGYVADRFFGKYWTIVGFSLPYIGGQLLITQPSTTYLIVSLSLLAMGSGVIKPNISTLMGMTYDQFRPGQTQLRTDAFANFYFAINLGAALSQFALPPIRSYFAERYDLQFGYTVAFMVPAALMLMAFIIFAAGKRYYATEVLQTVQHDPQQRGEQWRVLRRLLGLFGLVVFFWAVFDQAASTWIFFAQRCMDCTIFGRHIDPDQVQGFNPVFILILLPLVSLLWRVLAKRGIIVRPTDKMIVGFLLTAACMGVMALAAWLEGPAELELIVKDGKEHRDWIVQSTNQVSVWWQVFAYLVITVAEILISVTGLELAYTAAPKSMTGFVTACWLVTVGIANLAINSWLTRLYSYIQPMVYFAMLAGVLLAVTIAFVFVARQFNRSVEERVDLPSGAGDKFVPQAAPSEKISERDQYQSPT